MKAYALTAPHTAPERYESIKTQLETQEYDFELVHGVEYQHDPDWRSKCNVRPDRWELMKTGEICCAVGHDMIWQRIANGPDECALILECDAYISMTGSRCEELAAELTPHDFSWALLTESWLNDPVEMCEDTDAIFTPNFARYSLASYCCHGYLVSRRGARYLHKCSNPIWTMCDALTRFRAGWKELADSQEQEADPAFISPRNVVFMAKRHFIGLIDGFDTTIQNSPKEVKPSAFQTL